MPALIPAWNFFDVIADSPRVEFALMDGPDDPSPHWQAFRPLPRSRSLGTLLSQLVWNPRWNETLFVVSCAERLMRQPTAHSEDEIYRRIAADLVQAGIKAEGWIAFRLSFVAREGEVLLRDVRFQAAPRNLAGIDVR